MFNDTITIYNKYIGDDGLERWQGNIISGVHYESLRGEITRKTGVSSADNIHVIIPRSVCVNRPSKREYMPPKQWQALTDKSGYWTIQPGDTIVKGAISREIQTSIRELNGYDDVSTITGIDDKCFGGIMAHFDVTAK